jgi:hypothetical protein
MGVGEDESFEERARWGEKWFESVVEEFEFHPTTEAKNGAYYRNAGVPINYGAVYTVQ